MAKLEGTFKCPNCGKESYHHGISLDSDNRAEIHCWKDDGGCGFKFYVAPVFTQTWIYFDKFGYPIKPMKG